MGAVRGVVLESHYLLEPCGTGRTRLTHISRVDLRCVGRLQVFSQLKLWSAVRSLMCVVCSSCSRGRSPEWYNKAFGHLCVNEAQMIRSSFFHSLDQTSTEAKIWTPDIKPYPGAHFQSSWAWEAVTQDANHPGSGLSVVFFQAAEPRWARLYHTVLGYSHSFTYREGKEDCFSTTTTYLFHKLWFSRHIF